MKVLWVSNSPIGPAAEILGEEYKGTSGTWIKAEFDRLDKSEFEMSFLCTSPSVKKGKIVEKSGELGLAFCINAPRLSYGVEPSDSVVRQIQSIIDKVSPDVIHIWGTETFLSYAVSLCSKEIPKVVFIQGIIGVHKRYLGGYFNQKEDKRFYKGRSVLSMLKCLLQRRLFIKQADIEKKTLVNCKNVITDNTLSASYCRSQSKEISVFHHPLLPNKKYFESIWDQSNARPYSIFTVFGGNEEKGLQQLLKAVSILKEELPSIEVRIPGNYATDDKGRLLPNSKNAYSRVLYNMIKAFGLEDNVIFLGRLDVEGMIYELCHARVFVNPSCMEVHSSSMREAMAIGVPTISSVCGSALDYVENGQSGLLYRYEEYEVLAMQIKRVLLNEELSKKLSENGRKAHEKLFDGRELPLKEIYQMCVEKSFEEEVL